MAVALKYLRSFTKVYLYDAQDGVYDFAINDPATGDPRVGSGVQLRSVPLGGIEKIKIRFSTDVDVVANDLSVIGLHNPLLNQPYLVFDNYDSTEFTATWTVDFRKDKNGVLRSTFDYFDHYLIRVKDTITEAGTGGLALDGDWMNPTNSDPLNNNPLINELVGRPFLPNSKGNSSIPAAASM